MMTSHDVPFPNKFVPSGMSRILGVARIKVVRIVDRAVVDDIGVPDSQIYFQMNVALRLGAYVVEDGEPYVRTEAPLHKCFEIITDLTTSWAGFSLEPYETPFALWGRKHQYFSRQQYKEEELTMADLEIIKSEVRRWGMV